MSSSPVRTTKRKVLGELNVNNDVLRRRIPPPPDKGPRAPTSPRQQQQQNQNQKKQQHEQHGTPTAPIALQQSINIMCGEGDSLGVLAGLCEVAGTLPEPSLPSSPSSSSSPSLQGGGSVSVSQPRHHKNFFHWYNRPKIPTTQNMLHQQQQQPPVYLGRNIDQSMQHNTTTPTSSTSISEERHQYSDTKSTKFPRTVLYRRGPYKKKLLPEENIDIYTTTSPSPSAGVSASTNGGFHDHQDKESPFYGGIKYSRGSYQKSVIKEFSSTNPYRPFSKGYHVSDPRYSMKRRMARSMAKAVFFEQWQQVCKRINVKVVHKNAVPVLPIGRTRAIKWVTEKNLTCGSISLRR